MPRRIYVKVKDGSRTVYRQVNPIYWAVGGKAREVLKGYANVNGKARQCYAAYADLAFYGSSDDGAIEPMALSRQRHLGETTGQTVQGKAIIFGGNNTAKSPVPIDVYTSDLTHFSFKIDNAYQSAGWGIASASTKSFAHFVPCGQSSYTSTFTFWTIGKNMEVYKTISAQLCWHTLGTSFGSKAIFAGKGKAAMIDDQLTCIQCDFPKVDVRAAAANGKFAAFADSVSGLVVYDENLITHQWKAPWKIYTTSGREISNLALASVGKYIIAAGMIGFEDGKSVYAIDPNGIITKLEGLTKPSGYYAPTPISIVDYAIFAGPSAIDVYDKNLVKVPAPEGSKKLQRRQIPATVGDYALLAGGDIDGTYVSVMRLLERE